MIDLVRKVGIGTMVLHRSDDPFHSFIVDFTEALVTGHLKTGAPYYAVPYILYLIIGMSPGRLSNLPTGVLSGRMIPGPPAF